MKRFTYIIPVILITLGSCESELVQNPITTKTANNFYSNEQEMEEAINAVYAALQFTGLYDTGIPAMSELPGEDAYDETPANDGGNYGQLDMFNVISQNAIVQDIWQDSYIGIQRANIVINRIAAINYVDEAVKNSRIGEMKFIRALLYFNLVRIYGDVPMVIVEIENPQDSFGQTRTDKLEVYAQIRKDLDEAIELLAPRSDSNKMRVVKTAAQALAGKVALTLGDYAMAETYLKSVVTSGSHELLADIDAIFSQDNELNKEIIFAVQFASGINSNSEGSDAYRMFNPTGRLVGNMAGTKGHGVLKGDFYDLYQATDKRKETYVGILGSGLAFNNKIAAPSTTISDSPSDWVVLRYADVILMLAEATNELGKSSEAIAYLDMIRNRAGLSSYSGSQDRDSIFAEIDLQRRLELVWEGQRWFDLLRQGRAKTVLSITDDNKLLMPLPASQIAADPALAQNPGY